MKANQKKLCVALAIVGCALMLSGWAMAEFSFNGLFADKEEYTQVENEAALDSLSSIEIDTDTEIVRVKLSGGDNVRVRYQDSDKRRHVYALENGILSLRADGSARKWYDFINFSFAPGARAIELEIPAGFAGELSVKNATGDVSVENIEGLSRLAVETTTGTISIADCGALNARLTASTGAISVNKLSADDLYGECTTGGISVNDMTGSNTTLRFSTGGATLKNVDSDVIDVRGTTGDIRIDGIIARQIELRATTGSIIGSIALDGSEFTIDSHTATGQNNLGQAHFGGERTLKIETSTGGIHVDFVK